MTEALDPTDRAFIQDLVIADIEERREFGVRKYGTALQSGNGRDMLLDAYEEAIDLVIYLRGMKDEDHHLQLENQRLRADRHALHQMCVALAAPLGYATDGTTASVIHNITTYVAELEEVARTAKDLVGDHCESHSEPSPTCSTCTLVRLLYGT